MSTRPPLNADRRTQLALTLGALGIVFGDIGTSPLYTMRECVAHLPPGVPLTAGVLGVCSLMFWALVLVVCLKYLLLITRADNDGEGGIFALLALIHQRSPEATTPPRTARGPGAAVIMILVGAALLYGDGVITPAISVLGAAEGFSAISPDFTQNHIMWLACGILAGLFLLQHHGTKRIGGIFGPVMLAWFLALGALGAWRLAAAPEILWALDPRPGLALLVQKPSAVAVLLGAVVLTITGAEALYADMGHFGRRYITLAWYGAAFPGLVLNYFGQGAYLLGHPAAAENPFFLMAPAGLARSLLTGLSIVAAIIASQALISGAYSLTRQAIQLGYFPRLKVNYTNAEHSGQIYLPLVNTCLALGCIYTVLQFRSSANLAAAYGIAVTGTMAITTVAFFLVIRRRWRWPLGLAAPLCGFFLLVDGAFFAANSGKITEGGWFPLAIAGAMLVIMYTWKAGRDEIFARVYSHSLTDAELIDIAQSRHLVRVSGSAVFFVGTPRGTPISLLHHIKANRSLHRTVILLCVLTEEVPAIHPSEQLVLHRLGEGIWRAIARYGYMQSPNIAELAARIREHQVPLEPPSTVFIFNREMIIPGGNAPLWDWQKRLYGLLSRNANPAKDYYQLPPSQIIEIGLPLQL
ncbi:MAG TPA: KUP/HAK/KT family potassium transporter [Lacunisphaera sp.]|jgi:KUP system potassium uptake protein|nr:KUP/HAK/KT family potassium transporter [Lacunisphaera sp.]